MNLKDKDNLGKSVIILLGPPGSGKGTQAKRITETTALPHISTGDLFRYNISNRTELGEKAKFYMNAGKLVPDDLVLGMLFDRVAEDDCSKGYLLDGFPRTISQAEYFDSASSTYSHLVVINLEVSDETILKRISGRLSCKNCGHVQNSYFSPPKVEEVCDKCGGELFQRDDDKLEVVEERLRVYNRQTAPLVKYYESKGVLYTLNGEEDPDLIFKQVMEILDPV